MSGSIGAIGSSLGASIPTDIIGNQGADAAGAGAGVGKTDGASNITEGVNDFGSILRDKLGALNNQQADAAQASQDMATGRVDDVAQTMMRIEQANVSLQMATQVRNKVVEAYQEVLRMQM